MLDDFNGFGGIQAGDQCKSWNQIVMRDMMVSDRIHHFHSYLSCLLSVSVFLVDSKLSCSRLAAMEAMEAIQDLEAFSDEKHDGK